MQNAKQRFAQKLREAMEAAGYEAKPSVLEREFNSRYWGKPMTLHGVRRWLLGETVPGHRKLATLAEWLQVPAHELAWDPAEVPRTREQPAPWSVSLGYEDRELFDLYLRLPVPKRRLARDVILAIARAHAAEEAERAAQS
ncbi:XRE family transcriptional regulator [Comamonas sp. w2-DMI]|uniref:XRE family transcriptional regulator n=1 Tax=Comamonas terrae TaxID=673548 RepID=A0ABW5UPQ5_9BURK|nr:DNA-binding protein [Comamonas terrae]